MELAAWKGSHPEPQDTAGGSDAKHSKSDKKHSSSDSVKLEKPKRNSHETKNTVKKHPTTEVNEKVAAKTDIDVEDLVIDFGLDKKPIESVGVKKEQNKSSKKESLDSKQIKCLEKTKMQPKSSKKECQTVKTVKDLSDIGCIDKKPSKHGQIEKLLPKSAISDEDSSSNDFVPTKKSRNCKYKNSHKFIIDSGDSEVEQIQVKSRGKKGCKRILDSDSDDDEKSSKSKPKKSKTHTQVIDVDESSSDLEIIQNLKAKRGKKKSSSVIIVDSSTDSDTENKSTRKQVKSPKKKVGKTASPKKQVTRRAERVTRVSLHTYISFAKLLNLDAFVCLNSNCIIPNAL